MSPPWRIVNVLQDYHVNKNLSLGLLAKVTPTVFSAHTIRFCFLAVASFVTSGTSPLYRDLWISFHFLQMKCILCALAKYYSGLPPFHQYEPVSWVRSSLSLYPIILTQTRRLCVRPFRFIVFSLKLMIGWNGKDPLLYFHLSLYAGKLNKTSSEKN